ncbi:MAG: DUF2341 domain-containing protein [Ignavibacteria bacterium]
MLIFLLAAVELFSQPAGFRYEFPIYVKNSGSSTLTNFPIAIRFNTLIPIGMGWIQSDGRDIRFTSNCAGSTILPHYLWGYLNTDTTLFYVKIPSLPANDSVLIYLYCGNAAATQTSTLDVFEGPHSSTDSVIVTSTNTVSNCQRGFRFTPNQELIVTHFGKRTPNATPRYVTLFDFNTQAILAQITVDAGTVGVYNYNLLTTPLVLDSGRTCILTLYNGAGDMYYYGTSSQIGQHLIYHDMRYCNNCTQNTFPALTLTNYHYGTPDFLYYIRAKVTPSPTFSIKLPADTTTPLPPTGVKCFAGNQSATVKWNKNTEFDINKYYVYRNTVKNPGTSTLVGTVMHPDSVFLNSGLTNGIKYYYWVKAADRFCNERISDFSAPDSVVPSVVGVSTTQNELPKVFALYQNFPNPFNSETIVKYDLPFDGFVKLAIYDLLGREVKILVSDYKTAGQYIILFNALDLASGIYFYRIQAGDFVSTKRMIIIR